ncbi:MAG: hypothetical protein ABI589_05365 [Burkholderiales bacterium]
MARTHQPTPEHAEPHDVLRPVGKHHNQSALQRALRQERVARRRNFAGWLLTLLLAAGAGVSIIYWLADRTRSPQLSPSVATPALVPADPFLDALPDAKDAVPPGAEHALPAR